MYIYV
jgi:hypothetical protein